jgi:glutathione S-transferase
MADPILRIFSYLPNPRVFKATIAARLCGVEVEVRGARPRELPGWLWDFDARPLSDEELETPQPTERQGRTGFRGRLFKTDAFLEANPFGTVPTAFSPDGRTGIFESNSIMRAVGRIGQEKFPIYGADAYAASRIDAFLDASLVFARDSQIYLLALGADEVTLEIHASASKAFDVYAGGIEQAIAPDRSFLVGDDVTLADICFVAELALFSQEKIHTAQLADRGLQCIGGSAAENAYPLALRHYRRMCAHPACKPDLGPYLEKLERRG